MKARPDAIIHREQAEYLDRILPASTGIIAEMEKDAVKEEYSDYLDQSVPLLRTGGIVVADNVLWGGQVAGEIRSENQRESTEALRAFNQHFINHLQLRSEILSFGDGIAYGVKVK